MNTLTKSLVLLAAFAVSSAMGIPFDESKLDEAARRLATGEDGQPWPEQPHKECGRYVMGVFEECMDNRPFLPHRHGFQKWFRGCHYSDGRSQLGELTNRGDIYGLTAAHWDGSNLPGSWQDIVDRLGSMPHFFTWDDGGGHHTGIFLPSQPGKYGSRDDKDGENGVFDFFERMGELGDINNLAVYRMPNQFNDCRASKHFWPVDSSINYGDIELWAQCCWKERLPGEAPWSSRTTPYASLDWEANAGHVWDTLKSPRYNLAGCSTVQFLQSCTTTLYHGSNNTIRILGSTDCGATWPHYIGNDSTSEALLPWADNQTDVRIAWTYHGRPSTSRFWCIDDIAIWAKPTRLRDATVLQIECPSGIISHGQQLIPSFLIWNSGRQTESFTARIRIGDYLYDQTADITLPAYCDTFIECETKWTATPGTHTVVAYTSLGQDEFRHNDTAVVTVRVVADTWVRRLGLGNNVGPGAALERICNDSIYLIRGMANPTKDFLVYVRDWDLWKRKRRAPSGFSHGSDLVHTGGDFIYVSNGSKKFFRYCISGNSWATLMQVPGDLGSGGGLAWTGGNYIFVLKGGGSKKLYRYTISGNTWTQLADIPDRVRFGGALCWTGGDYVYAFRGNHSRDFYRYKVSTNTWETMAETPFAQPGAYKGADLTWDYTHDCIYATLGEGTRYFLKYDIAANTWTRVYNTPVAVKLGGALAYSDYSVFGIMGKDYTHDVFWRYSTGDTAQPPDPPPPPPPPQTHSGGGDVIMRGEGHGLPTLSLGNVENLAYIDTDTLDETESSRLYMQAEGDTQVCLTPQFTVFPEPTHWSADESTLAVAAEDGLRLIETEDQTSVLLDSGLTSAPRWSPDHEWVAYTKWDDGHGLYKARADGSDVVCLDNSNDLSSPRWAPDGQTLVCERDIDGRRQLALVDAETGELQSLTDDYYDNLSPAFTPDGQWIYFNKTDHTRYRQVYRIRPAGTDETSITGEEQLQHGAPDVSEDGLWVCYTTAAEDEAGKYYGCSVVEAASVGTSERICLTDTAAVRRTPVWGPVRDDSPVAHTIVYEERTPVEELDGAPRQPRIVSRRIVLPRQPVGSAGIPQRYVLHQNVPNPFRLRTSIRYAIPVATDIRLQVFDLTGRLVRHLARGPRKPGYYTAVWDGKDNTGRESAAGVYFYELRSDDKVMERKMLYLK